MTRHLVVGLVVACTKADPTDPTPVPKPTPPPKPAPPTVRLAIVRDKAVEIHELTPDGLVPRQVVKLPGEAVDLEWPGVDPIVMLAKTRSRDTTPLTNRRYTRTAVGSDPIDGVVGRITAQGFVAYPRPPDSAWSKLDRMPDKTGKPTSSWEMYLDKGQLAQSHCLFEVTPDMSEGFGCVGSRQAVLDRITDPVRVYDPPKVAPASSIKVSLEPFPGRPEAKQLLCSSPATSVEFPPRGEAIDQGMSEVRWYANDPPIFSSLNQWSGYVTHGPEIVFEGCAVSKQLENPVFVVGPDGVTALYTDDKLLVIWQGRVVATAPGSPLVELAPTSRTSR